MHRVEPYLIEERPELAWVAIPKAGFTCTLDAFRRQDWTTEPRNRQTIADMPLYKVAMLRDPYQRIESAYRMFQANKSNAHHTMGDPTLPFAQWVRQVTQITDADLDSHLVSQWDYCCDLKGVWMVDHLSRWDWEEWEDLWGAGVMIRANSSDKSIPCVWTPDATKRFEDRYSADLDLWNS
jgi:hypothetical protein